jgi:hypothetical protein
MPQTLNFAVNVDQSQVPAIFQQVQSGISAQLQSGAMQLGNMTSNVASMMNSMTAAGANPAAMTMAYSMSPGAINHQLGKQPFMDRTAMLMDFTNQAYGAVQSRASSIIAYQPIGPKTASYAQSMTSGIIGGVGDAITGVGAMMLSNKLAPKAGFIGGSLLWAGAEALISPLIGDRIKSFGRHMTGVAGLPEVGSKDYLNQMGQMIAARDLGSMVMSLGPQRYVQTKFGASLNQNDMVKFGSGMQKLLYEAGQRTGNEHYYRLAAGGGPAMRGLVNMSLYDDEGARIVNNLAAGARSGRSDSNLFKPFIEKSTFHDTRAKSLGYSGWDDPAYGQFNAVERYGGAVPEFRGPNRWQIMGRELGFRTGLGRGVGENFMNKFLRLDAVRDLGLTKEQREMLGGTYGIAAMYGGIAMQNASTFGTPTSLMYAAAAGGTGMPQHISQVGPAAARVLSDPGSYFQFRLNYKDTVSKAGGAGVIAMHKKLVGLQAEHLMAMHPTGFKNRYEARRAVYETIYGLSPEAAAASAGIDESVGMTIVGKGGGKQSLVEIFGGEEAALKHLDTMEEYRNLPMEQKTRIANAKRFNRKNYTGAVQIGPATAQEMKRLITEHKTIEAAAAAATDPGVKEALIKAKNAGATEQAILDPNNEGGISNVINMAGMRKDITLNKDVKADFDVLKNIKSLRNLSDEKRDEIIDALAKGTPEGIARANELARKSNIKMSDLDRLDIKDTEMGSAVKNAFRIINKGNYDYVPSVDGQAGVFDSAENDKRLAKLFLEIHEIYKKQSVSPVRDRNQKP